MWCLTRLAIFFTTPWMHWLFLLAGLSVWLSSAFLLIYKHGKIELNTLKKIWLRLKQSLNNATAATVDNIPVPDIKIVVSRPKWIEILSVLVVAAVSSTTGYFYRDHQELQNTFTFHDVLVVKQEPPSKWLLSTTYTGEWWITVCNDYTPNWHPGYRLKLLVYEDRGCKRLSGSKLGYIIERDEYGNPKEGE